MITRKEPGAGLCSLERVIKPLMGHKRIWPFQAVRIVA